VPFPRYAPGMMVPGFDGDPDYGPMWAGESVSVINEVRPAGDLVRELAREAEAAWDATS
jgi:nitronate monooxygenase